MISKLCFCQNKAISSIKSVSWEQFALSRFHSVAYMNINIFYNEEKMLCGKCLF